MHRGKIYIPKMLFREKNRVCWAMEVLIRYGEREDVRRNLRANFSSEGWIGSESLHYQNKKQWLLEFAEGEEDKNIRLWIDEYVDGLDRRIEQAKIDEERWDF